MDDPLVSVILPNFNSEQFIGQAIDSVLSQTYKNLELIVVDDCSNDKSIEIIKGYLRQDHRIHLVRLETNSGGPATPRNTGVLKSKGQYIAFIDSDDVWFSGKLETQIDSMKSKNISFISSHKYDFKGENTPNANINLSCNPLLLTFGYNDILKKCLINTSTVVIKKKLLDGLSFNSDKKYVAVEDYLLWLDILKTCQVKVHIYQSPLVFYRKTISSISSSKVKQLKKVFLCIGKQELGLIKQLYYTCNYVIRSLFYLFKSR